MPTAKKITSLFPKSKAGKDAKGKGAKGAKRAAAAIVEEEAEDESETYLKILKTFDMSTEYGPALGLTRLERWKRAEGFGLHPPADVHKILTERDADGTLAKCVWENIV
uniref:DNA polymerase delta subunit 4 n=1 Tax=Micromonas pusilla TaxID=38833 RepID=A0A7R9XWL6_MICPS|mmetsp:Transcript_135/g.433  ORF Transcript_135/g.433 Transcript_135/m.433 type:complete len:109 (+) Transcript_135:19-345(+)